jgi:lauroyl/myristoyl acyltransferase
VVLLFPVAAVMAACELTTWDRSTFDQLRRISDAAERSEGDPWPRSLQQIWAGRVAMCMARFIRYWPDKLRQPRWRSRCQFAGLERLEAIIRQGRPVVLATLHYGNLTELYHWLRSRGIGVAFLTDASVPAYQNRFDVMADRVNGLEGVRRHIGIGHLQLGQVGDFLAVPNRVLVVVMDGYPTRRDVTVRGPGYGLRIAPGALHLAAISRAAVIPCLFVAGTNLRCTIRLGEPLSDDVVADRDQHVLGCQSIVQQLGPWIGAQPEQSDPTLLRSFNFGDASGLEGEGPQGRGS